MHPVYLMGSGGGPTPVPTDWIFRVSANDAATLWSDFARTTQASPGDRVHAWQQVDAPSTADVLDSWEHGTPPTLIDRGGGFRSVRFLAPFAGSEHLGQNSYDNMITMATAMPGGAGPFFTWQVVDNVSVPGSPYAITSWGSIGTSQRAYLGTDTTGGGTPIDVYDFGDGGPSDAQETSAIVSPAVLFAWTDGITSYLQVNNGPIRTSAQTLSIIGSTNRAFGFRLNRSVGDGVFDCMDAGVFGRALSTPERQALYDFLIADTGL
jgi:hypothetical protein